MIIGKAITTGGNGGIPCTLVIATAPDADVIATLKNVTISTKANELGVATFELTREGTWTVTATQNGISDSTEVVVDHNVNLTLHLIAPLYIYTSGDSTFRNCVWETMTGFTLSFPPYAGTGGETITDSVKMLYTASAATGDSSYAYFFFTIPETFSGYNKLCFELYEDESYWGYGWVGFLAEKNGAEHIYEKQTISGERTIYEFDISQYQNQDTVAMLFTKGDPFHIYNIWLE